MKILVVDDEPISRQKMKKILEGLGECQAVDSGTRALETFRAAWEAWSPFDLITLDVSMPDVSGMEVLTQIRSLEESKQVPPSKRAKIVMVTACADRNTVVNAVQGGCNDYVTKPFDPQTVARKVFRLCPD